MTFLPFPCLTLYDSIEKTKQNTKKNNWHSPLGAPFGLIKEIYSLWLFDSKSRHSGKNCFPSLNCWTVQCCMFLLFICTSYLYSSHICLVNVYSSLLFRVGYYQEPYNSIQFRFYGSRLDISLIWYWSNMLLYQVNMTEILK